MIILNKKKIIIFHNKKTSGSSLGILMSLIKEKGDYITFHNVKLDLDKKIIKKINLNKNLFNINYVKSLKNTIRNIIIFILKTLIRKFKNKKIIPFIIYEEKYYGHTTPEYFKKHISNKIYNDYSKFTIYRKFSDQIYSMYNHKMSFAKKIESYDEWVSKNLKTFYKETLKFYTKDIYFFNYHNMEDSLKVFCKKFKIDKNLAKIYKKIHLRTKNIKFPRTLKKSTKEKIFIKEKTIYKLVKQKLLSK
ncbi:hypothetical protein [Candidatus Pelagibacter communis]|jgi:hypothetical protein|uniref:hypothetical protein n=1 Tax=Pelagibacter ubique TaxID=198252 RepID=UPI00040AE86A|nr:hypothetical protein [Candidatus Pelagibacter ubique]